MTTPNPQPTQMEQRTEPSPDLFMSGKVPEPLDAEQREWLVRQLIAYPKRVDAERTCAIGALMDMATAEFCRMQSRPTADLGGGMPAMEKLMRSAAFVATEHRYDIDLGDDGELVERGARQLYRDYENTTEEHVDRVFADDADPMHIRLAEEMREWFKAALDASGAADRLILYREAREQLSNALLSGTLSMTEHVVCVHFESRADAEAMFVTLEGAALTHVENEG